MPSEQDLEAIRKLEQASVPGPDAPMHEARASLNRALQTLKARKPNDRSDKDRYWAIVITEVEKAMAVFDMYIMS